MSRTSTQAHSPGSCARTARLLVSHEVTWSKRDSFCNDQYANPQQPEEFPTAPVRTQVKMLPEQCHASSFEKFNFDKGGGAGCLSLCSVSSMNAMTCYALTSSPKSSLFWQKSSPCPRMSAPSADAKDLNLVNRTGEDIIVLNCTPSISDTWYNDILGNSIWRNGEPSS